MKKNKKHTPKGKRHTPKTVKSGDRRQKTQKQKNVQQSQTRRNEQSKELDTPLPSLDVKQKISRRQKWWIALIIIALSFILYGNTISFTNYVLDDKAVISNNQFTKKGFKGVKEVLFADIFEGIAAAQKNYVVGGRYRPLSLVIFAVEWELFASGRTLTPIVLKNLQEKKKLPQPLIKVLDTIKGKEFETDAAFHQEIHKAIGAKAAQQYYPVIYEHSQKAKGNAKVSHFINVLLYAITGIFIFLILAKFFETPEINLRLHKPERFQILNHWYFSIPFLTTILFLVHPLHTEVIANIKGRDEILVFLFSMFTLWLSIKYFETKQVATKIAVIIAAFISFLLAFLSKENAITFIAIIPMTLFFFVPNRKIVSQRIKNGRKGRIPLKKVVIQYLIILLPLIVATVVFLIMRRNVLGEAIQVDVSQPKDLMNNPFLEASIAEKYATISYTLGLYLKLLFVPHPLTFDYYPYHIPIIGWLDLRAIIPLLLYLAIGVYGIVTFMKKSLISYGIWFYLITFSIVSNIVFPIGAFMSERFMYISSLGFCLIIIYLLVNKIPEQLTKAGISVSGRSYATILAGFLLLVGSIFSVKTIVRNRVWESEFTLFTHDVNISTNSAKSNYAAGYAYANKAKELKDSVKRDEYYQKAFRYLNKAVEIHPAYENVLIFLATTHYEYNKNYKKSIEYYTRVIELFPNYDKAFNYIEWIFINTPGVDGKYKLKTWEHLATINPNRYDVNYNLGIWNFQVTKNNKKTIKYLEKAVAMKAINSDAFKVLGVAYGQEGSFEKSRQALEKALQLNPRDPQIYSNLAAVYQRLGDNAKAQELLLKMQQIR